MTNTKTTEQLYIKLPSVISHETRHVMNSIASTTIDSLDHRTITKAFQQALMIYHRDPSKQHLLDLYAYPVKAIQLVTGLTLHVTQIAGALALNKDAVAEMKTGEGKTLTAVVAASIAAVREPEYSHVHIVTVNDYLAKRDYDQLKEVYELLGLSVGLSLATSTTYAKRLAYRANITYVTNSELGFDYLRDNLVQSLDERTLNNQFDTAIVDEADSIFIDDAKTPLIIAGNQMNTPERYQHIQSLVETLLPEDYVIDHPSKTISLSRAGHQKLAKALNVHSLYEEDQVATMHLVAQALTANFIEKEGVDYLVTDNHTVELIDANTGRVMTGRRFNDGLMEALEAKEKVEIHPETKTIASITYQNLFRFYHHLSGMTGTAYTEKEELRKIYDLKVIQIPTYKPMIRVDEPDQVFIDQKDRLQAVVEKVIECHNRQQPIMVAAENVTLAEAVDQALTSKKISHQLLTAKDNADEAKIVALAGNDGAVTITTNMAGRGTDIKLSGTAAQHYGLYVLGVGRNDAKRIDDQLRGRSGRQGDVGQSCFYVALDDALIKRLAERELTKVLKRLGKDTIDHNIRLLRHVVNRAQRLVEGQNYDSRKQTLEYDSILNEQRQIVYQTRDRILQVWAKESTLDTFKRLSSMHTRVLAYLDKHHESVPDELVGISKRLDQLKTRVKLDNPTQTLADLREEQELHVLMIRTALNVLDEEWSEHMVRLESIRTSMSYRSYAQTNPLIDYQNEGVEMYDHFLYNVRTHILTSIAALTPTTTVREKSLLRKQRIAQSQQQARKNRARQTLQL